jgi:hypothetical protein
VKFTRRAYNGTGRLIGEEYDRWRAIAQEGLADPDLAGDLLEEGNRHYADVQEVVHGGHPKAANQRAISAWLARAGAARADLT